MKRLIGVVAAIFVVCAANASAQEVPHHHYGALGFHNIDAPLGVRWWLTGQKIALDAGLGFGSDEIGDESFSHWTLDVGLPVLLRSWDKVHFIVRPGIAYNSQEVDVEPGPGIEKDNDTQLVVSGELEAEVFLAEDFSVSAAHGFAIVNNNPAVGSSTTDWGTTGSNFTHIGFHVYLFSGH
jgi:hypothetical protein